MALRSDIDPHRHDGCSIVGELTRPAFARVAEALESGDNAVRLLRDGPETYPRWLEAIRVARHHVHLENYIIRSDAAGEAFADALIEAAGRGVACRVLYDWMGCFFRTRRSFWRRLAQAGVDVRCYNPPKLSSPLGWISRDHRKVLCVDGDLGFTGGLCIAQDWLGRPDRSVAPWRDTSIEIRGTAVAHLEQSFADSWQAAGPPLPEAERMDAPDGNGSKGLTLGVIPGKPQSMGLYRLEQLIAQIVQHSLWISDAYFVATTGYARVLCSAARAGVDVRILVPGINDNLAVGMVSRAGYYGLLEAGVRIFEWNGPMMHAKTAVADGCWARIGSSNSNLASWISNRELDVTIFDQGFASQMAEMFEDDIENATEVTLQGRRVRPTKKHARPGGRAGRRRQGGSRLLAGAVGLGSAASATIAQHRQIGPKEDRLLLWAAVALAMLAVVAILVPELVALPLAAAGLVMAASLVISALKPKIRPPDGDKHVR